MNFLLAFLSASAHSVNNIALRTYQTKLEKSAADLRLFQSLAMFLAAFAYWASNGFSLSLEPQGLLLALCYGLATVVCGITISLCYQWGPMSLTSVIANACVVLPIAVGCIFYRETMTVLQILGCILLGITLILPCFESNSSAGKIRWIWFPLVLILFFSNGMGAVLMNIYGRVADASGRNAFLAIAYCISAVFYLALSLYHRKKLGVSIGKGFLTPLLPLLLIASGIGSFIGNGILMSLNTRMPASILYPMVNGGIGVLLSVISCTVFKEKLTLLKFLAIVVGIASIVLLNL